MNLARNIVLFVLLFISLPIGSLFEIFSWNNQITKTEFVLNKQKSKAKARICSYQKIVKELRKDLFNRFIAGSVFSIKERITSSENLQSILVQNDKTKGFNTLMIRRSVFNTLYIDDSEIALRQLF